MATTDTSVLSNNVVAVLDKAVELKFASKLEFAKAIIDNGKQHESGRDANPGDPVKFTLYDRLPVSTSTLSESSGGTAASVSNTQKSVTLLEKGNFVTTTEKLERLSFHDIKTTVSELVADNAARSTDQYAMEVAESQTGAAYNTYVGQTAKSLITASNVLSSAVIRQTYAKLDGADVPKIKTEGGEYYLWFLHPNVAYDLKTESSGNTFREAKLYARPEELIKGEIGAYEGFRFISTTAVKTDYIGGEEKQAATTVDGAHSAGATTLAVVAATGIVAGNVINVVVGGVNWALQVTGVSSNDLTINKAVRKDGFFYPANDGDGLPVALSGGESVEESSAVYSNYAMGANAFGYGYAVKPESRVSNDPSDPYGRLSRVAWYALHGIAELYPEALHKVYCSSAINPNS